MIKLTDKPCRLARLSCVVALLTFHFSLTQAQAQRWWGYYTDASTPHYMGTQVAETYTCCAQYSASRAILSGATIHGVRFALRDKTNVSDVQVFLSSSRPNSADQADISHFSLLTSHLSDLDHDGKMTEVTLPESYAMPASGSIYVGFAFKLSSAKSAADKEPIVCAGQGNGGSGTFWIRSSKSLLSWNDMGVRYGALALQLLVSNASLPAQSVKVAALERAVIQTGQTGNVLVSLASEGLNAVSSIDYVLTVGGQPQSEQHYVLPEPLDAPGSEIDIDVPVTAPSAASIYEYSVQVTKANASSFLLPPSSLLTSHPCSASASKGTAAPSSRSTPARGVPTARVALSAWRTSPPSSAMTSSALPSILTTVPRATPCTSVPPSSFLLPPS